MGNRAVITFSENENVKYENYKNNVGIYLHWNGGRDSVEAFLTFCKIRGDREDDYGISRLVQVIGNFIGGTLSLGVGVVKNLDYDNYDNGVYIVKDWEIIGRDYFIGEEQMEYDLKEMIESINSRQPKHDQIPEEKINKYFEENAS